MLDLAALARRVWGQVWPANDEALLATVLHPQFRNHAAPPQWRDGLQGAVAVVHQLNDAFSELRYVTLQTLVDGDRVAVHNTCTGRHIGPWAGWPVGAENSVISCGLHVLVDETAEPVSPERSGNRLGAWRSATRGRLLMQRAMRTMPVVMIDKTPAVPQRGGWFR